jgi:hypothetical protein
LDRYSSARAFRSLGFDTDSLIPHIDDLRVS